MLKQERLLFSLNMTGFNSNRLHKIIYLAIFKLTNISNQKKYEYLVFRFPTLEDMFDELNCLAKALSYDSFGKLSNNTAVVIEYDEQLDGKKKFIKLFRKKRENAWPTKILPSEFVESVFSNIVTNF